MAGFSLPFAALFSRATRVQVRGRRGAAAIAVAPWLASAFVALWVATTMSLGSAQWGDNFEQFVWAHSYEWGYHKHPPLPTWLLAMVIDLFGPSVANAAILGGACTALTGWFTYRIAQRLLGSPGAALALLVWGLQQAFSMRASLFNHNTVMMLAVAATTWAVLRALDARARSFWWLIAGAGAGAALLSKYQAVVPLAGIVFALVSSGEARRALVRNGMVLAALVATALFLPHALWSAGHDFSTVTYATQHGRTLSWPERGFNVVSFLAQQVRLLFPAILFSALLLVLRGARATTTTKPAGPAPESAAYRRAWLLGLIGLPLALTVLSGPLFGLALQNHWGFQCLQFAGLFFADRLRRHAPAAGWGWLVLALLVHGLFVSLAWRSQGSALADRAEHRIDSRYPAKALADAVQHDWQDTTLCPLRIVVGPSFEAGMVSVYSGGDARVFEDGDIAKSPWISADDLQRDGAVYVATDAARLPKKGVSIIGSMDVSRVSPAPADHIYWAIVPPLSCDATIEAD